MACTDLSIEVDPEMLEQASVLWLRKHISPCSRELLDELQKAGIERSECLLRTIANEVTVQVLSAAMGRALQDAAGADSTPGLEQDHSEPLTGAASVDQQG